MPPRKHDKSTGAPAENAAAARRSKRRRSSTTPAEEVTVVEQVQILQTQTEDGVTEEVNEEAVEVTEFPRSKRVRFSRGRKTKVEVAAPTNGATDTLRRTTISPALSRTIAKASPAAKSVRRVTLPASFEPSRDTSSIIQQLQYAPLKQVLDERIKRRLRRSRLSEEYNEIEERQKEGLHTRHDVEAWKQAAVQREEKIKDLMLELELQRQFGIEVSGDKEQGEERLRAMETELAKLKEEVAEKHGEARVRRIQEAVADAIDTDDNLYEAVADDDVIVIERNGEVLNQEDVFRSSFLSDHGRATLTDDGPDAAGTTTPPGLPDHNGQDTMVDTEREAQILAFEQAIAELTRKVADATAALQIITIELKGLGFASPDSSVEEILVSIRQQFRQARLDLEHLLPGETSAGFDNGQLLEVFIRHIRSLLERLHDSKMTIDAQIRSDADLRIRFSTTLEELEEEIKRRQTLEIQWQELDQKIDHKERRIVELEQVQREQDLILEGREEEVELLRTEVINKNSLVTQKDHRISALEKENSEHAVSIVKLQSALQTYRDEVQKLENLISKMEQEHQTAIENALKRLEETTDTMQERIDSEKRQRETAEAELDQKDSLIAELNNKLHEAGIHANELRQRLYELQLQKQEEIKNLEEEAAAREEQYQTSIGEEIHRREHVERLVLEQKGTITDLKEDLDIAEGTISSLQEKIDHLTTRSQHEIADLNDTIKANDKEYMGLLKSKDTEIQSLIDELDNLQATLQDRDQTIKRLEREVREAAETHSIEISQKEEQIANLASDLDAANDRIEHLESENKSLSERVSEEAEQYLTMTAQKDDEIDQLRTESIRQIQALQSELARKGTETTSIIEEKEETIEELESIVTELQASTLALKSRLREENEEARRVMEAMYDRMHAMDVERRKKLADTRAAVLEDLDQGFEDVDAEVEGGLKDAEGMLAAYREESGRRVEEGLMETEAEVEVMQSQRVVKTVRKVGKKSGKRGRKSGRKFADSGIGVDGEGVGVGVVAEEGMLEG